MNESRHAEGEHRLVQFINDRLLSIFNYFMDKREEREERDEEGGVLIRSIFPAVAAAPSVAEAPSVADWRRTAASVAPATVVPEAERSAERSVELFVDSNTTDETMNTEPLGSGIKTRKLMRRNLIRRKKEQTRRKRGDKEQTRRKREQLKKKRKTHKF